MQKRWGAITCLLLATAGCQSESNSSLPLQTSAGVVSNEPLVVLKNDWPGWRGPLRNGQAPSQPLLTHWDEETNLVWRAEVPGRGHSSPVVVGNSILLTTADEAQQEQSVLAYRRSDGVLLWQQTLHKGGLTAAGVLHHKSSQANNTVACDNNNVYVVFLTKERIIASTLELETGKLVWQRDLEEFVPEFGFAPAPLRYQSLVIYAIEHSGGGFLIALEAATGKEVWRTPRQAVNSFSSPIVAQLSGRDQLLISGNETISSYDPQTGKEFWQTSGGTKATCGTIVTTENLLFVSGGFPQRQTLCLDGNGQQQWTNNTKLYEPSLLIASEALYGINDEGIAHCWSLENGELLWRERLRGGFSASPVLCNGLIYVTSLQGETYVFRANSAAYEEVAINRLGDDCYTSAAIVESRLYLRIGVGTGEQRREQLVCLGEK